MDPEASYMFTHAICRRPGRSIVRGLRASDAGDPDFGAFAREHAAYVDALADAGVAVSVQDPLESYPDSVFVEDPALCVAGAAIILRPGAPSRFGEREAARAALREHFDDVIDLRGGGFVDGGDILVTGREVLVGLSSRTDSTGVEALSLIISELGLPMRVIRTPPEILHFKTDCGLLDDETVFCTRALAASGCFAGYRVIECPEGEEAAANLIRVNGVVLTSAGHPATVGLLAGEGYDVRTISTVQAARLDGGLSCMSLRFRLPAASDDQRSVSAFRCQSGSASTSNPSPSLRISKRPSVTVRTHRADFFSPPSG